MIADDDDGPAQLSSETLKALQEWQQEQEQNRAANVPQEDWVSDLIKLTYENFYLNIECDR
jgi:hypothetical protein